MTKAQRDITRKLRVLKYADEIGNVSKACRYFGITREGFYKWKRAYLSKEERQIQDDALSGISIHAVDYKLIALNNAFFVLLR